MSKVNPVDLTSGPTRTASIPEAPSDHQVADHHHHSLSHMEQSAAFNSAAMLQGAGVIGAHRQRTSISGAPMTKGQPSLSSYTRRQLVVLASVAYGNFWLAACVSLQAPFFPQEAEQKGASSTVYGLVFGIYELVIFFMSPMFGKLISVVHANVLVQSGLLLAAVSTILFGLLDHAPAGATFISLAFGVRILEGIGAAAFMTSSYTLMAAEFPERVATIFALLETCFGLGLILGPTVGGALYQLGGYWLPFVSLGTFMLLGAIITSLSLPDTTTQTRGGSGNLTSFVKDFNIILDAMAIATSLNFIGFNAATLEPHLRQFELTPLTTGSIFVVTGAVYALTSPLFGKLCDMGYDEKTICLMGCCLCVIGSLIIGPLPWFDLEPKLWLILVALAIIGLGISAKLVTGFVDAFTYSIKVRGLPDDMSTYGLVSAMFFSSCSIGAFIGPSAGGYLLDHYDYRTSSIYLLVIDIAMMLLFCVFKLVKGYESRNVPDREPLLRERRISRQPSII
ncbi:MFS-type transporter SLC18B1 [Halotydeus destructor]|nr:MFS-type transporter SLC18B1 [Halotydeus destructor]